MRTYFYKHSNHYSKPYPKYIPKICSKIIQYFIFITLPVFVSKCTLLLALPLFLTLPTKHWFHKIYCSLFSAAALPQNFWRECLSLYLINLAILFWVLCPAYPHHKTKTILSAETTGNEVDMKHLKRMSTIWKELLAEQGLQFIHKAFSSYDRLDELTQSRDLTRTDHSKCNHPDIIRLIPL